MNELDTDNVVLLPAEIYEQIESAMFNAIKEVVTIVNTHSSGHRLPPDVLASYAGIIAPSATQVTFLLLAHIRTHVKAQTPLEVIHATAELTTALAAMATSLTLNMNRAKEFAKQNIKSH